MYDGNNYGDEEDERLARAMVASQMRGRSAGPQKNQLANALAAIGRTPGQRGGVQVKSHSFDAPVSKEQIANRKAMAQALRGAAARQPRNATHPAQALPQLGYAIAGLAQDARANREEEKRRNYFIAALRGQDAPPGVNPDAWQAYAGEDPEAAFNTLLKAQAQQYQLEHDAAAAAAKRQAEQDWWYEQQRFEAANKPPQIETGADGYKYYVGQTNPDGTPMRVIPGIEKAPDLTTDQRNFNAAQDDPAYGDWLDRRDKNRQPQINLNTAEGVGNTVMKELAKDTGKLWSTYQAQGSEAASMVQDLDVLDELIRVAPQGPLRGRLAEMFPGISDAGAAFDSIVKRAAPKLRVEGSGSQSDREFDGFLRSFPALRNRPEANALIAQTLRAKANINIQRAEIVSQVQQGLMPYQQAQEAMTALDGQSILTPQMQELIDAVNPRGSGTNATEPGADGWQDLGGGVRIRRRD